MLKSLPPNRSRTREAHSSTAPQAPSKHTAAPLKSKLGVPKASQLNDPKVGNSTIPTAGMAVAGKTSKPKKTIKQKSTKIVHSPQRGQGSKKTAFSDNTSNKNKLSKNLSVIFSWRPSPHVLDRLRQYALLTRQDRPIGWLLLLWPTYWGLWLAAKGTPPWSLLLIFTLGVITMRSAGCVINDYADRRLDPQVQRTKDRPLAAGRVTNKEALWLFFGLLGFAFILVLQTNSKTILLSLVACVLAVIYPFTKRYTWTPQLWLGAAFGMSIPMAFTAVTNEWPPVLAWLVLTANMLWSVAYDTYYAMVDRDDDMRAGSKSTAILFGDLDLVAIGIIQASFLLAMMLIGSRAELDGYYSLACGVAVLLSLGQLWIARSREREACFAAFRYSHWIGLVLWLGMVLALR
jgi:4-hydroxybenzoate polyprenyltransferase